MSTACLEEACRFGQGAEPQVRLAHAGHERPSFSDRASSVAVNSAQRLFVAPLQESRSPPICDGPSALFGFDLDALEIGIHGLVEVGLVRKQAADDLVEAVLPRRAASSIAAFLELADGLPDTGVCCW